MAEQNIDELRDSIVDFLDKALVELENPQAANLLDLQNRVERFLAGAYLDEHWNDVLKIKRLPRPWSIREEEYQKALKEFLKTLREQFTSGSLNPTLEQVKPNTVSPEILKEQIRAHDEAKAAKQAYEAKWKNWYANYKRQLLQKFYAGMPPEEQTRVNSKPELLNQYAGRVIDVYRADVRKTASEGHPKRTAEEFFSRNKIALREYALSLGLPPSLAENKPKFLDTMRILEGLPEPEMFASPAENQISQVAEVAGVLETARPSLPPELAPHVDDNTISHLAVALVETGAPLGVKTETTPTRTEVFAQLENMAALLAGSPLSPLQKAQLIARVWDLPYPRKFFGLPSSQEIINFITKKYELLAEKGRLLAQPLLVPIRGFFLDLPGSVSGFFGGIFNSLFSVFNSRPAGALATGLTTAGNQLLPGLFSLAQNAGLRQRQAGFAAAVLKGTAETFFGKYKYYILGAVLIFIFLFLTSSTFLTESAALLPPSGSTQFTPGGRPGSVPGVYPDNIASGTCPIEGGHIRTGSYDEATNTGHGSSDYWGHPPPGSYPIPTLSMYPGCWDTSCDFYGFAVDVEYPGGAIGPVRVPFVCPTGEECPDQDIPWTVVAKWFICGGGDVTSEAECIQRGGGLWGWGAVFTATANGHDWRLYLAHFDRKLNIGDVYSSSTNNIVGGLYQGDMSNPHVHVEINMDTAPKTPDFLCSG